METFSNGTRFGVNYTPSRDWWFQWQDWEPSVIERDLDDIRSLGMDHIRIQCLWHLFQPFPNRVDALCLKRLSRLMDMAHDRGLEVQVTALTGWLSGFVFAPAWIGRSNIFTDARVLEGTLAYFRELSRSVADHPAFMGFDLGNEINVLAMKGHGCGTDPGDRWARTLLDFCGELAPHVPHVNGIDHWPWYRDFVFSRKAHARTGGASILHSYLKWSGTYARWGTHGKGSLKQMTYLACLADAYAADPGRPVWVQEFGLNPASIPDPDRYAEWAVTVVRDAMTVPSVKAFTWWCSHDLDPNLPDFSEGEKHLGLFTSEHRAKPVALALSRLIAETRRHPPEPVRRTRALSFPEGIFAAVADDNPGRPALDLFNAWLQATAAGEAVALVTAEGAADKAHLEARGILEVRPLFPDAPGDWDFY